MAHALGVERAVLLLDPSRFAAPADFEALVARRLAHEPVAYILGTRDFWTIRLRVGPGVLIPRPDSETLIEAAIAHFGSRLPRTILDLGTDRKSVGSGQSGSVSVDLGGRRIINKTQEITRRTNINTHKTTAT